MTTIRASKISPQASDADARRWQLVLDHDGRQDGAFVYAVRSTGIYCRPSCPSRRPARRFVEFYEVPQAAEAKGFRACKRCRPERVASADPHLKSVRAACAYIDDNPERMVSLSELSERVGLSPSHLQRLFKRLVGISPRDYADARRLARFRVAVRGGDDVTGALYEAGYGSASRLYERAGSHLGMTPASYARGGAGAHLGYAIADGPIGRFLVAATGSGVAFLAFGDNDAALEKALQAEFPAAERYRDDEALGHVLNAVLRYLVEGAPHPDLPLDVRATAFQRRVWRALTTIPDGQTRSYSQIAAMLGNEGARRAVGRACAGNPVSLLIPCHRAVRGDGGLGGYRWGENRKRGLIERERARANTTNR
ncbi:MAG: bifunctional DNA-binding transcriptional regulator/O6-methylguanine-DNA methyltransferase Ada [Alphaproteobacteria bacterium]|nr:bifunctional DNA-binding transcriptional regulator/O6-methylguanine-DNA methyltransferase Ada [Alphaproteobacteria bacterium]